MNHNMKIAIVLTMVVALLMGVGINSATAAERMKYEDYVAQLKANNDREAGVREEIEQLNKKLFLLKDQYNGMDAEITAAWDEIYAYLGITREDVARFNEYIDGLEARANMLAGLKPEDRLARKGELDELLAEVKDALLKPAAKLSPVRNRLERLESQVNGMIASLPKASFDNYTVIRGDCLWNIAKKQDMYGDPFKWPRIWSANKTIIKNPDLIFPKQTFRVPRVIGPDQVVTKRGDTLKKIAARPDVYGDPFKWTKIHQANKSHQFLADPNVVWPEMILDIPRN